MRPLLDLFKDLSNVFAGHTDCEHIERPEKDDENDHTSEALGGQVGKEQFGQQLSHDHQK